LCAPISIPNNQCTLFDGKTHQRRGVMGHRPERGRGREDLRLAFERAVVRFASVAQRTSVLARRRGPTRERAPRVPLIVSPVERPSGFRWPPVALSRRKGRAQGSAAASLGRG
jgi:hypothetical protein